MRLRSLTLSLVVGAAAAPLACGTKHDPTSPPHGGSSGSGGTAISGSAGTSSGASGSGGTTSGTAGTTPVAGRSSTGGGAGREPMEAGAAGASDEPCEGGAAGEGGESSCPRTATLPSCIALANTCGPSSTDDCCASTLVPATTLGSYARSNDPAFPATVNSFRLDRYEVTVGRFRTFVAAYEAGWRPADGAGKNESNPGDLGWLAAEWDDALPVPDVEVDKTGVLCDPVFQSWTRDEGSAESESRPINCVTWYLSMAFCIWDGGRLPSEAEWNYAASGGPDALGWRQYPWSDPSSSTVIDEARASYYSTDCLGDGEPTCTLEDLIAVGSKPSGNGRWGHADLGGNVGEWTYDLYGTYPVPCDNCSNQETGADRTFRGGSYDNDASYLLTSSRRGRNPAHAAANVGVRCARSAGQACRSCGI